jgi:hypothetical protein
MFRVVVMEVGGSKPRYTQPHPALKIPPEIALSPATTASRPSRLPPRNSPGPAPSRPASGAPGKRPQPGGRS